MLTFSGRTIDVPSMFIGGKSDWGVYQTPRAVERMPNSARTRMVGFHLVDGAGHWVQQEQPERVSALLMQFLRMALHPDGTIWSTGPGSARRLNPVTKAWSSWDTPTWLRTKQNPGGYGITVAGDGRAWFAMNLVDRRLGRDRRSR